MPQQVHAISALSDNYIWLILNTDNRAGVLVDPGDAAAAAAALSALNVDLVGICLTHHHADHTAGVLPLLQTHSVPVYGPKSENIAGVTHPLSGGEVITLPAVGCEFTVISVPGHTAGHIAYYGDERLFCGDTLFSMGCGRLFEGTAAQMFASLQRLAALPPATKVYCAHEYTLSNLSFACMIDANNPRIRAKSAWAHERRAAGMPTIPSLLSEELALNPFLRCGCPDIQAAVSEHGGVALSDEVAVFAAMRRLKDGFRA